MCDPFTAIAGTAAADASATAASTAAAVGAADAGAASITAGLSNLAASTAVAGSSDALLSGGLADLAASTIPAADAGWTTGAAASSLSADAGGLSGINFARMLNIGSTIFSTAGNYMQGKAGSAEKNFEANQLDQDAQQKVAAGTAEMQIEGRNTDLAVSKARNNAAAGGGSLDPSVVNILGDLEKQGGRNEANTLYNAQSGAASEENQATADRFQAKNYGTAGDIGAVAGLFSGLTKSMSAKYGGSTSLYGGF